MNRKLFYRLFGLLAWLTIYTALGQDKSNIQGDIDTLTNRLTVQLLQKNPDATQYIKSILPDGSWKDIDYADSVKVTWTQHIQRLLVMSTAYSNPANSYYHTAPLLQQIDNGFQYIYAKKLRSLNWYDLTIGAPSNYMQALLLLKGRIPDDQLLRYASFLKDDTGNKAHMGQNRISVSVITIYKGCIENNLALINRGFASLSSTLVIADPQGIEGIKIDNSFHQHRPQLYSGGYGMGFVKETSAWMLLSNRTAFAQIFTPEKRELLSHLMLQGHQLFGYRDVIDFGTIGRGISRVGAMNNVDGETLDRMVVVDPEHAADYRAWKAHLAGAPFPKAYQGNKYFWKSDIMTQHGADYYLSAKVISTRSVGTEMLNGENQKGYNLPLGATNIVTDGREYRNIFPVWDWTKVPGTTAVNNQSSVLLSWYLYGGNNYSGGVSDGKNGAIAYEHSYNGVQANKAYFFIDGAMLCLGSGINALGVQSVLTTVNQCFLNGDIIVNADGSEQTLTAQSKNYKSNLQWLYHSGVGYFFPNAGNITVKKDIQSGTWKSLSVVGSDSLVKAPVFSAWFNHGTAPTNATYSYVVVPAPTLEDFKNKLNTTKLIISRNTADIQAIQYGHYTVVVFYQPGVMKFDSGLTITSSTNALLMLEKKANGYQISAGDPLQEQVSVTITVNKRMQGPLAKPVAGGTAITLVFPTGDLKGKTVSAFYNSN